MSGSESEYEEEETLVMVDLHGVIDSELFSQDCFNKFKILGIDTDQPILQVENFMFTGEYAQTMGTAVMFEEEEKRVKKSDPVFCKKPPRMLKYVCKTNKKLNMKRVFVSEKAKEGEGEENEGDENEEGENEEGDGKEGDGNKGADPVEDGELIINEDEMDTSQGESESIPLNESTHGRDRSDNDVKTS